MRKGTRRQIWQTLPRPILKTKRRLISRDALKQMLVERAAAVIAGRRAKAKHSGAPETSGAEPARADYIVGRKELLLSVLTAVEDELVAELAKFSLKPDSPDRETTIF